MAILTMISPYLINATAKSDNGEVYRPRGLATAMAADRDAGQRQKRAFGVAKRLREISSDQARRQKACFFRKRQKPRKNIVFCGNSVAPDTSPHP